jgi:hypothetical protein
MSLRLFERNEGLYNDWKSKTFKMWELVAKYHLSVNRIYFIVNQMKLEEQGINVNPAGKYSVGRITEEIK